MKFTTPTVLATTAALASSAMAQTSPLALLSTLEALLSSSCADTITGLVSSNSSLSACIDIPGLLPILDNNSTSVIPQISDYLMSLCASPACDPSVIQNATSSILSSCATDLSTFGISNSTVEIVMGAYPSAREIACLSSNETTMMANSSVATNLTMANSTLCPISLLTTLESYLGSPLTNTYIDTALLGGNATAYNDIMAVIYNTTLIEEFACNDCVAGAVDIVLENYPVLDNLTFSIPLAYVEAVESGMGINATMYSNATGSMNYTISSIYTGLCAIDVGYNATLPASLNETAYNVTLPTFPTNDTAGTVNITSPIANITARGIKIAREY